MELHPAAFSSSLKFMWIKPCRSCCWRQLWVQQHLPTQTSHARDAFFMLGLKTLCNHNQSKTRSLPPGWSFAHGSVLSAPMVIFSSPIYFLKSPK